MTDTQHGRADRPPHTGPAADTGFPVWLLGLLDAECLAESTASGTDVPDLRQGVWLRWLEHLRTEGPPADPAAWLRAAVRAEGRPARRRRRLELPLRGGVPEPAAGGPDSVEAELLRAERRRAMSALVGRLPGRCPAVLRALLSLRDPTYPEVARELGISQGSVGPVRSRCLGCLRRMLTAEVAPAERGGMVR